MIYKTFFFLHIWSLVKRTQFSSWKKSPHPSLQESQPPDAQHPRSTPAEQGRLRCHRGTGDICAFHSLSPAEMLMITGEFWSWPRFHRKKQREEKNIEAILKQPKILTSEKQLEPISTRFCVAEERKKTTSLFEVGWKHNWLVSNSSQTLIWHLLCYIYLFQAGMRGRNNVKTWSL